MCEGDRDRSDVATDQRNWVFWELGEAEWRSYPRGHSRGTALIDFSFLVFREAP